MTDTLTERDYWAVLRAVLETVPAGTYWSAAKWHTEAVLAELSAHQIDRAQKRAVKEGWLERVGRVIDGEWSPNMTRATHELANGRWIQLYLRTGKGYPEFVVRSAEWRQAGDNYDTAFEDECPGQVALDIVTRP